LLTGDILALRLQVNLTDNSSYVTFTDDVGADTDIRAVRLNATGGVLTAEFDAAQNSPDFDINGASAILTNGNLVTVYQENDSSIYSIEVMIRSTAGAQIFIGQFGSVSQSEPQVASLAGGGFVTVWTEANDIKFQVRNNAGATVSSILTAAGGSDNQNEPQVVALPDGGFVIVWDNDTDGTLEAQRFNANGTTDGSVFTVENVGTTLPHISVTGDGRILFAWQAEVGEIFASIWDPREAPIDGADYTSTPLNFVNTNTFTATLAGGVLDGTSAADNLFGNIGADTINGLGSADQIHGGGGADILRGNGGADKIYGGNGADKLLGGNGADKLVGGNQADILKGADRADDLRGGKGADRLFGGDGKDKLFGNGGSDLLFGNGGADTLNGGAGRDQLTGGNGDDMFVFDTLGFANADTVTDFGIGFDEFWLDASVYTEIVARANDYLRFSNFRVGTGALDGNDHIIYNPTNGKLFYDADGVGGAGKVLIAELDSGLILTANDFFVF